MKQGVGRGETRGETCRNGEVSWTVDCGLWSSNANNVRLGEPKVPKPGTRHRKGRQHRHQGDPKTAPRGRLCPLLRILQVNPSRTLVGVLGGWAFCVFLQLASCVVSYALRGLGLRDRPLQRGINRHPYFARAARLPLNRAFCGCARGCPPDRKGQDALWSSVDVPAESKKTEAEWRLPWR
jgi:hypothetical protein